jgi:hypothetical protein
MAELVPMVRDDACEEIAMAFQCVQVMELSET